MSGALIFKDSLGSKCHVTQTSLPETGFFFSRPAVSAQRLHLPRRIWSIMADSVSEEPSTFVDENDAEDVLGGGMT